MCAPSPALSDNIAVGGARNFDPSPKMVYVSSGLPLCVVSVSWKMSFGVLGGLKSDSLPDCEAMDHSRTVGHNAQSLKLLAEKQTSTA